VTAAGISIGPSNGLQSQDFAILMGIATLNGLIQNSYMAKARRYA